MKGTTAHDNGRKSKILINGKYKYNVIELIINWDSGSSIDAVEDNGG